MADRTGAWRVVGLVLLSGAASGQVPEVSQPPLVNDVPPGPVADVAPPPTAPLGVLEAIDRQLLSFRQEAFGLNLANREKSMRVGTLFLDDELDALFVAVPAATLLIKEARDKAFIASALTIGGYIGLGGAAAILVAALVSSSVSLPLLLTAVGLDVAALVVTLVSIPFRLRAQTALYEAVETHNRGLLRRPITSEILPTLPNQLAIHF